MSFLKDDDSVACFGAIVTLPGDPAVWHFTTSSIYNNKYNYWPISSNWISGNNLFVDGTTTRNWGRRNAGGEKHFFTSAFNSILKSSYIVVSRTFGLFKYDFICAREDPLFVGAIISKYGLNYNHFETDLKL